MSYLSTALILPYYIHLGLGNSLAHYISYVLYIYVVAHHFFPHFAILSWDNNIKVDMKQVTRTWTVGDWLHTNTAVNTAINRVT